MYSKKAVTGYNNKVCNHFSLLHFIFILSILTGSNAGILKGAGFQAKKYSSGVKNAILAFKANCKNNDYITILCCNHICAVYYPEKELGRMLISPTDTRGPQSKIALWCPVMSISNET